MPPNRFSKPSTFNKAELVEDNLQTPKRGNLKQDQRASELNKSTVLLVFWHALKANQNRRNLCAFIYFRDLICASSARNSSVVRWRQ